MKRGVSRERVERRARTAWLGMPRRVAGWSTGLLLAGASLNGAAWAAAEPRAASGTLVAATVGAGTAVPTLGVSGMVQAVLGLLVVLGMVLGFAWLARRFGLQAPGQGGMVKVVGGAMLTQKERVVVVEVAGTWLVLGVAPGHVSMLHTLPAGSAPPASGLAMGALTNPSFANRLRDSVGKRFGNPPGRASQGLDPFDARASAATGHERS
jgi:flagellar protein FliO/FliZ